MKPLSALLCWCLALAAGAVAQPAAATKPPNVVLIMADDLGFGELGSYGQTKIRTPHLDRLAAEGMAFERFYSGAPVCAPARCVLLTGMSLHRAPIRGNREVKPEGQFALPAGLETLGDVMRSAGYRTGAVGKWGLGAPGSIAEPNARGFDFFFGYNCQRQAHNYYPRWLWHNRERVWLDNPPFRAHQKTKTVPANHAHLRGHEYAPALMLRRARAFLRHDEERPFFLYLPLVEPHLAMQPPEERVAAYPKEWDTKPYLGGRGYLPHRRPRAGYAAMITDLDAHVGAIMETLREIGADRNTLVLFTSDNGPTHDVGGVDTSFFASSGGLRGRKGSVFEGGLRVPLIARWPGRIAAGVRTSHLGAFQDVMATLAQLTGAAASPRCDGVSFLPTLLGEEGQDRHEALCWEFFGYGGQQAVITQRYKIVRQRLRRPKPTEWMLFDLQEDPAESEDLAASHPEVVSRLAMHLLESRTEAAGFEMPAAAR